MKGQKEIYVQHEYLVENVGLEILTDHFFCRCLLLGREERLSELQGKQPRQLLDSEIGQALTYHMFGLEEE